MPRYQPSLYDIIAYRDAIHQIIGLHVGLGFMEWYVEDLDGNRYWIDDWKLRARAILLEDGDA